jgi:UDP-N-acetylmuramoyl-L-alanyl-D-glutamate--2,6-diaminopimelate ligase
MDAYLDSKALLFRNHLVPGGAAVVNIDDPAAEKFLAVARDAGAQLVRTTRDPRREAEIVLEAAEGDLNASRARVAIHGTPLDLTLPLVGDFNLENLVVAVGVAAALGIEPEAIREGTAACPQVPGRMEVVRSEIPECPTVIVDYAHTPDAVAKLLEAVRPLAPARLVTVFGCGGDRDRSKRPLMAEAVAALSDRVIATSDNPRTEDPDAILRDVEAGLRSLRRVELDALASASDAYAVVADRRLAIARAIASAEPEDTIVLAGKGHEDYQIVGRTKLPFDDRAEARRALALRGES